MASAVLLVNETYDNYAPQVFSNTGAAAIDTGVAANALGLAGNYTINNPAGGSGFSFSAGGLAFGSYNSATGNKLEFRTAGGGTTLAVRISASTVTAGSTLYSSYLTNIATSPVMTNSFVESRISSSVSDSSAATRFRTQLDASSSTTDAGAGVGYSGSTTVGSATALTTGTTYMVISRFTNVGQTVASTATVYVLTLAQYNSFAAAAFAESYLDDANAVTSGSVTQRTTQSVTPASAQGFATNNFSQIGGIGTNTGVVHIDALKYGTDLLSVVTIPEPSATALLGLGLMALAGRRRR